MIERTPRFALDLPMRVARVRGLSLALPALYLLGVWLETGAASAIGLLLMMLALVGAVLALQKTGVHRVTNEHSELLDDGERMIRDRVLAQSYRVLAISMVAGIVYADIASDVNRKFGWSLPLPQADLLYTTGAVILFSLLLPSALLAWRLPVDEVTAD